MPTHSSILAWRIPSTEATVHRVAKSWTHLSNEHILQQFIPSFIDPSKACLS